MTGVIIHADIVEKTVTGISFENNKMAQLNMDTAATASVRKAGVKKMIKHNLKIDMTPMVDLGFLLITFL
jgi:hypothetical protein